VTSSTLSFIRCDVQGCSAFTTLWDPAEGGWLVLDGKRYCPHHWQPTTTLDAEATRILRRLADKGLTPEQVAEGLRQIQRGRS